MYVGTIKYGRDFAKFYGLLRIYELHKQSCFENLKHPNCPFSILLSYIHNMYYFLDRFNHSCRSNAESGVNDEREIREIKAVSKIKAGEEITINYDDMELSMKSFKSRQDYLFLNWGFHCQCDMCHEEKLDNQDEIYKKFQRLKQDANKLLSENKNLESLELEKICKEIFCYKEMYKFSKGGLISEGIFNLAPALNEITVQVF